MVKVHKNNEEITVYVINSRISGSDGRKSYAERIKIFAILRWMW